MDLLINFMTGLPISTGWNYESYNSILVIVGCLMKMVHYRTTSCQTPWPSGLNYEGQRLINHLEILFIVVLLPWH